MEYTHTHTHTHNEILFNHKKQLNNAIYSNMDGHKNYHAKWNKSKKDKSHMI